MSTPTVFVELNGGLFQLPANGKPGRFEELRLQVDSIPMLKRFSDTGFAIRLLDDPGNPLLQETAPDQPGSFVLALLASQGVRGVTISQCCNQTNCDCSLPGIGLVADVIANPGLDRARSIVVGNRDETDRLARAMGISACRIGDGNNWNDIAHRALDAPRQARVQRKTRETDISVFVDLDRTAEPSISTGIGFFDHMLEQLGKHGGFELRINCSGDLEVDEHHTIEDVALATGKALRDALGDKLGIGRYGFVLPMDEAQVQVAIDLSGRAYAVFDGDFPRESVGGLPTELVPHFFHSLSETLGAAIHITVTGDNAHHMVEACFKGTARALRQAFARQGSELPSTKGVL